MAKYSLTGTDKNGNDRTGSEVEIADSAQLARLQSKNPGLKFEPVESCVSFGDLELVNQKVIEINKELKILSDRTTAVEAATFKSAALEAINLVTPGNIAIVVLVILLSLKILIKIKQLTDLRHNDD